jgi:glycosyltransferase involved in cell wall biosynthesis
MMKKRILYCEGNLDNSVGGSHYSLFYLLESLNKNRYQPVVVFHRENRLIPMYRNAGLDTRIFPYCNPLRLPAVLKRNTWLGRPLQLFLNAINIMRMIVWPGVRCAWYLRTNHVDLVHLNNTIIRNHHWMLGAMLARVKCISHERGINEHITTISRLFARSLAAIICISVSVRDNLARQGIGAGKLVIIHNGLDPGKIRPTTGVSALKHRHAMPEEAPVIGIVGNLKDWKGQEVVIRAVARLHKRWPGIRCLLVGDAEVDPAYTDKLRKLTVEKGLQENIIFTGYQSNVADFLNAMDVVVHASILPEPFGRVLLEGMVMQKPVVGSDGGAVPEIVQHGVTGYLFAPGDHDALADSLSRLLEDKTLAGKMGEEGYRRAVNEFGIRRNTEKTETLYEELFSAVR